MINGNKSVEAIYDSGSTCSLINERVIKSLRTKIENNKSILRTLTGREIL